MVAGRQVGQTLRLLVFLGTRARIRVSTLWVLLSISHPSACIFLKPKFMLVLLSKEWCRIIAAQRLGPVCRHRGTVFCSSWWDLTHLSWWSCPDTRLRDSTSTSSHSHSGVLKIVTNLEVRISLVINNSPVELPLTLLPLFTVCPHCRMCSHFCIPGTENSLGRVLTTRVRFLSFSQCTFNFLYKVKQAQPERVVKTSAS